MNFSMIYVYNFIVSLFLLLFFNLQKEIKKKYIYFVTLYYLLVFGQRWFGGIDFPGYLKYYTLGIRREIGYGFLQTIFKEQNIHFSLLIFIIYAFTTLVSLWFFRKFIFSNLSIFLFFLSEYHIMSLNPLRTYIAINIFLIGLYFCELKNKKIFGFLIMNFGILFHTLTIGVILSYVFLKRINILKFHKILDYTLFLIPLIDFRPVLKILTNIFLPKFSHYFGGYFDQPLSSINIIRYYIILILFLYFKKSLNIKGQKRKLMLFGIYNFMILMGIATHFGELHRVAYFYKIFEPIFFFHILDYKNIKKTLRILIVSIFLLNYVGIIYKDMGTLKYCEIRRVYFFDSYNKNYYLQEIEKYYNKWEVSF